MKKLYETLLNFVEAAKEIKALDATAKGELLNAAKDVLSVINEAKPLPEKDNDAEALVFGDKLQSIIGKKE